VKACLKNPLAMAIWAALVTLLVLAATLPWFLGLLVIGPVLGYATWHAYLSVVTPPTHWHGGARA